MLKVGGLQGWKVTQTDLCLHLFVSSQYCHMAVTALWSLLGSLPHSSNRICKAEFKSSSARWRFYLMGFAKFPSGICPQVPGLEEKRVLLSPGTSTRLSRHTVSFLSKDSKLWCQVSLPPWAQDGCLNSASPDRIEGVGGARVTALLAPQVNSPQHWTGRWDSCDGQVDASWCRRAFSRVACWTTYVCTHMVTHLCMWALCLLLC